jgi:hypothetical protein
MFSGVFFLCRIFLASFLADLRFLGQNGCLVKGNDTADTLAAVLKEEPDLKRVPARVRKLLGCCLEKDPKKRLRDIGECSTC